jgi:tetratricopeptide (TPR) repeat protein
MALIYQGRGTALMCQGKFDQAIADFNHAIELQPGIVWAHFNRGLALLVKGDEVGAQSDFDLCLKLRPSLKAEIEQRIEVARELRQEKQKP